MGFFGQSALSVSLQTVDAAQRIIETYKVKELTYTGQPNLLALLAAAREGVGAILGGDEKKSRFGFGIDVSSPSSVLSDHYPITFCWPKTGRHTSHEFRE